MSEQQGFPLSRPGRLYLTEGGTETEIMYKYGFELPHFAMFPLLDNPAAVTKMRDMFRYYLDVVAKHKLCALIGGLDYRASPDWGKLLGYSDAGLAEANLQSIDFLRDVAAEYAHDIEQTLIQGLIGPRGDAYQQGHTITAEAAEDYHAIQLTTLKKAGVDLALAITFNNVEESIGVARAAKTIGVPLAISLTLNRNSTLGDGTPLADAIEQIDQATDHSVEFYSINCSHPIEYEPAIDGGPWLQRVRGVRPNASKMEKVALCKIGHLESGDPVELGEQCGELAKRYPHMDIWGGCCGTWDQHLDQIALNIRKVHGLA
ncbi:homocysteine S-methyltransferase family protein [Neptuniibacter halophilus]|uniref:homocysteine S-methyltransferase family protein n=1 Tax=Neptuniibacter halophilus TaxID=651666 RepID=UPI00257424CF|nr:homocysteine S-methyltransferase family protein [Neptuniibacter halophilus]